MRYITQEDPIGAYAVDYADPELRGDAQTGTVEVSIVFRRSAAEIDAYRDRERRQRRACEDPAGAG